MFEGPIWGCQQCTFGGELQAIEEARKPAKPNVWVWVRHGWLKADPNLYPNDPYLGTQWDLKPIMCTKMATVKWQSLAPNLRELTPAKPSAPKQHKPLKARPHKLPIPQMVALLPRNSSPYPQTLTPAPSLLCPHCLTKNHLWLWSLIISQVTTSNCPNAEDAKQHMSKT